MAALAAHTNPPPYPHRRQGAPQTAATPLYPHHAKSHVLYRSAPYLPLAAFTAHSRYASTQNLSDAYVQLPTGYSTATLYAAATTRYEAPPPPLPRRIVGPSFTRARSDDNILNSVETATRTAAKYKRLPPPPPPTSTKPPMPSPPLDNSFKTSNLSHNSPVAHNNSTLPHRSHVSTASMQGVVNTLTLPHKIQQPAITSSIKTSVCSTSVKNTTAAVNNNTSPTKLSPSTSSTKAVAGAPQGNVSSNESSGNNVNSSIDILTLREKSKNLDLPMISALCNDRSLLKQTKAFVMPSSGTKLKYPITAAQKKTSGTGQKRNPNDKLPALPGEEITQQITRTTTKGNNYVLNGPGCQKHKSVHSQS